jgi:hypothetical protein
MNVLGACGHPGVLTAFIGVESSVDVLREEINEGIIQARLLKELKNIASIIQHDIDELEKK